MIELGARSVAIEDSMDYVGNVDRFGEILTSATRRNRGDRLLPETVDVAAVEADLQAQPSKN